MARKKTSLVERTLVQVDRAFWCIHENLDVLAPLGLPTVGAVILVAVGLVAVFRTWDLPGWADYLIFAVAVPFVGLIIFTVLSLPCAVYAWRRARGEEATAGDCFAFCLRKGGSIAWLVFRLSLMWLPSILLFGLPLLSVWPRTCLTPIVLLFEDQPRVFRRSRRILKEDVAIYIMGGVFLSIAVVLGVLIFVPRVVFGTATLGAHLLDAQWRRWIIQYVWIFESLSAALVVAALAMSWWMSLTLLYHEIRTVREGEDLRHKVDAVREKLMPT